MREATLIHLQCINSDIRSIWAIFFHKLHYILWWEISLTCQTTSGNINKTNKKNLFSRLRRKVRRCTTLRFTVIVSEAV